MFVAVFLRSLPVRRDTQGRVSEDVAMSCLFSLCINIVGILLPSLDSSNVVEHQDVPYKEPQSCAKE